MLDVRNYSGPAVGQQPLISAFEAIQLGVTDWSSADSFPLTAGCRCTLALCAKIFKTIAVIEGRVEASDPIETEL